MFVGLTLIGVTTFIMSIRNSTVGAHQLSQLFSHERNAAPFSPDTKIIDQQIAALQASDGELSLKTKSGRTNWAAQPIKSENAKSLAALQEQRKVSIEQQRNDWEKEQSIKADQSNYVADLVLASGGWTELLQLLLMVLRVACEKSLDNRQNHYPTPSSNGQSNGIAHGQNTSQTYPTVQNNGRFTYFNRKSDGNVQNSILDRQPLFKEEEEKTVAQSTQTVAQQEITFSAGSADHILELLRQTIQKDISNFRNPQAQKKTVSGRICTALDDAFPYLTDPAFLPSRNNSIRLYAYLVQTVFPTLNQIGWPYQRDTQFAARLLNKIPDQ